MSGRPLPASGRAAAENELLARIGLSPSASAEDVDQHHLAVSQYLAAAPVGLKGWAHAQAAALDEAYLQLTDPVGLEGSALKSPTRPPAVVPGGPATPPARRESAPAARGAGAAHSPTEDAVAAPADVDVADFQALYASVTPSAHPDMLVGAVKVKPAPAAVPVAVAGTRKNVRKGQYRMAPAPAAAPPASAGPWKWAAILASGVLMLVIVFAFVVPFVFNLGSGTTSGTANTAQASASATTVDMQQVAQLMTRLQANPGDIATLQALGDAYYKGGDYTQAGQFYDKLLAIDPKNVTGLLARGACYWNTIDLPNAEKAWKLVVSIDPKNQEAHYDLGFLYMNQPSPNWTGVQAQWNQVIAIDSTTALAQTVQQHLTSLVAASMIPAPSSSPGIAGAPSTAPSAPAGPSNAPTISPAPAASASAKP